MLASAIEFRLRMLIQIVIVAVGYWAPWIKWINAWDLGKRVSTLEWLALELSRGGLMSFASATPMVIVLASLIAGLGMVLRVWGTAHLGYATVHHGEMQAGTVMTAGPYRYLRNPLYLGGWFMMIGVSMLMPPTGALFTIVLIGVFYLRLILGEEAYLAGKLGEPYQQYQRSVPRLFPRLPANLPKGEAKPRWMAAIFTEINPIGIFITLAFLSWSYDNGLMVKAVVITFLISMLERGLILAPVATVVFLGVAGVAWWPLHLRPAKAALIGLGVALIVYALMPGKGKRTANG